MSWPFLHASYTIYDTVRIAREVLLKHIPSRSYSYIVVLVTRFPGGDIFCCLFVAWFSYGIDRSVYFYNTERTFKLDDRNKVQRG